ncbi:MAG: flagellar assembly protein T N-terminal domain-containing protein [Archangium sp.]
MNPLKLSAVAILAAFTAFAQATVVTREAVGQAAVVNKDEAKAFEEAKAQALRSAVEQAAGVRIDADTVVVNNQLVRDQVFANTSGYVKKYDILEKKVEKGVATVKVKADIITDNLDKDITAARDLVKRMGRPSIVIVVQEQTIPLDSKAIINSESMATVLTESLKADGWDIKDAQAMNKKLKLESAATLGASELKEIGDLSKASYVLYGKAVLRHAQADAMLKGSPVYPVSGEYDLALAATDSDEQIVKLNGKLVYKQAPGTSMVISYERTAFDTIREKKSEIVEPVRKAILEHFRDQTVNGKKINVSVSGLDSFNAAKDFRKSIEAMKGIKEATQDGFANGKAAYRVTFLGSTSDFAEQVETSTFKKKKLNVVSVSGNTLELQVGK